MRSDRPPCNPYLGRIPQNELETRLPSLPQHFDHRGLFGLGLAAGCSSASEGTSAAASEDAALSAVTPHTVRNACDQTKGIGKFHAFCLAQVVTDLPRGYTPSFGAAPELTVTADHKTTDVAYGPSDFQSAYAIPAGGEGVTVAIIDAQDDPNAESDLAVFRSKYGLPACTTANGCFKKVAYDGTGRTKYPTADAGWGVGDLARSRRGERGLPEVQHPPRRGRGGEPARGHHRPTRSPLAVDTAAKLGAKFISNSYGITETTDPNEGITKDDAIATATHYVHPGVAIFASSGDSGFARWPNNTGNGQGANFPASIPQVFAVGGTRLVKSTATARGWSEGVWGSTTDANGASNSGCSHFFAKPSYQTVPDCSFGKEVADLSADADPASGMNIYDTFSRREHAGDTGWLKWSEERASPRRSPLASSPPPASSVSTPPSSTPTRPSFNDVTTGENGTCKETKLCNGVTGYDGPTGIGTPDGDKIDGKGVDGGAPTDGGTATDSGTSSDGGSKDGGGAKDGGGPVDAGPVDSGPEDAGPSVTWTTIYEEAFAPGTPGHCGNSGCHEKTQSGFACGTSASSCLQGMISKGLLDTANPTESTLGSASSSPLRWVNTNGVMPADNKSAEPQLGADIAAWVKAGAPGIE